MGFEQTAQVKRYVFEILSDAPIIQGVFTRNGGVSPAPWNSLNLGGLNGDSRANVIENRKRIFEDMGRRVESIFDVWQVHGTEVICTNSPRLLDAAHLKADAILTDSPDITLFMRFADCVPILFYDPVKKVVGIAHAGWQGTVKKIAGITVDAMREKYGSKPENILAGIGPSIGVDHYQVGKDVADHITRAFSDTAGILIERNNNLYLDLWAANYRTLYDAGIRNIQVAGVCTACDTHEWFSHRAEKGSTGRFGATIALRTYPKNN